MKTKTTLPLLSILLFAITACNNNGTSIPQLKFDGMKGNVSMVKESEFGAIEKFGEIAPDYLYLVKIYEYDRNGNQTKIAEYHDDGDWKYKYERTYEDGIVVSSVFYLNGSKSKKREDRVIAREKNHIKYLCDIGTDEEHTEDDFFDGLYVKNVDKDGNLKGEYFYDNKGRLVEHKNYHDRKLNFRLLREFDKDNNVIKESVYYSCGEPDITTYSYPEYDKKGNWTTRYKWNDGEVEYITKREITYR